MQFRIPSFGGFDIYCVYVRVLINQNVRPWLQFVNSLGYIQRVLFCNGMLWLYRLKGNGFEYINVSFDYNHSKP